MNNELDRKEKKIGKLQEIVKESDTRLSELKDNIEVRDFLEKKQRVLSTENNKLKKDYKKIETQFREKEYTIEIQAKQIKDANSKFKTLEELKSFEIEILKNDINEKENLIDQYENNIEKLNMQNDNLSLKNRSLEAEVESLKKLVKDALQSLKDNSMKGLKAHKGSMHPVRMHCEYQLNDLKSMISQYKRLSNTNEQYNKAFMNPQDQEFSLLGSLDDPHRDNSPRFPTDTKGLMDDVRSMNNIEVLIEGFEALSTENRVLCEQIEKLKENTEGERRVNGKENEKKVEQMKDSIGVIIRSLCVLIEEFDSDYNFVEKEATKQARDIILNWKIIIENIKQYLDNPDIKRLCDVNNLGSDSKNNCNTRSRVLSSLKNSQKSRISLLDDSIDQEIMFRDSAKALEMSPEPLPHTKSEGNTNMHAIQEDIKEESPNQSSESYRFRPRDDHTDENFTFDISPEKNSGLDIRDLVDIKSNLKHSNQKNNGDDLILSGFGNMSEICVENERTPKKKGSFFDKLNPIDERQMEPTPSKLGQSQLLSVSKSINFNSSSNPIEILRELKARTQKKDKVIKFLKSIIRDLLKEMHKLTSVCLEFDPDNFTENDLVDFDVKVSIPIDDHEIQTLPNKISSNLDKMKAKQMKAYLNGARRVLSKLITEDTLESSSTKDKKTIYTYMKDITSFETKNWLNFDNFLTKIDHISLFLENKNTMIVDSMERLSNASSQKGSIQLSEKQFGQMECIIKEVFRLTTPYLQGYYEDNQPDLENTISELKHSLSKIISSDNLMKKQVAKSSKIPHIEPIEILKQEMILFLKGLKMVHLSLSCEFSVDYSKVVARLRRCRQVLKELMGMCNSYFVSEGEEIDKKLNFNEVLKTPLNLCSKGETHPVNTMVSQIVLKEIALINIRCRILEERFSFDLV